MLSMVARRVVVLGVLAMVGGKEAGQTGEKLDFDKDLVDQRLERDGRLEDASVGDEGFVVAFLDFLIDTLEGEGNVEESVKVSSVDGVTGSGRKIKHTSKSKMKEKENMKAPTKNKRKPQKQKKKKKPITIKHKKPSIMVRLPPGGINKTEGSNKGDFSQLVSAVTSSLSSTSASSLPEEGQLLLTVASTIKDYLEQEDETQGLAAPLLLEVLRKVHLVSANPAP